MNCIDTVELMVMSARIITIRENRPNNNNKLGKELFVYHTPFLTPTIIPNIIKYFMVNASTTSLVYYLPRNRIERLEKEILAVE